MFKELFSKIKYQSADTTNEYIAKIEKLIKTRDIPRFQDVILLTTIALLQNSLKLNYREAQNHISRELNDPLVTKSLEKKLFTYENIAFELTTCSDLQLLTYILFAEADSKKGSEFNSGMSINKLLAMLLKDYSCVFDWGFGYGQFLLFANMYGNEKALEGIELDQSCYVITKIRLWLVSQNSSLLSGESPINLKCGNMFYDVSPFNPYLQASINAPFKGGIHESHAAVIHPTLGKTVNDFIDNEWKILPSTLEPFTDYMGPAVLKSEWPFILTALETVNSGGKLYAITTNGAASTETYSDIRKYLVKRGLVECVVQLSENLLPGTAIPATLWIFSKNNESVRIINASDIRTKGRRKFSLSDGDIEKIMSLISDRNYYSDAARIEEKPIKDLSLLELKDAKYNLSPSHHTGDKFLSEYMLLKDVCRINRGILLEAQELDILVSDDNSVKYVTPKHLNNRIIDMSEIISLTTAKEIPEKKSVSSDSIIMTKLLPFKAGYIGDTEGNLIFSNGNTYYLTIDKQAINPLFLFMYLNSEVAKQQIDQLSRGSKTSTLSISDLKELKIPLIKRSVQNRIVDTYRQLLKKEEEIQESLQRLEKEKNQLIEEVLR